VNIPETADLVELLAAANVLNRLDPKTPEVWAGALSDLEYRDCMQAAVHLVRTAQWVKIADIRDTVHAIRADRIREANLVYDGIPEETGVQSAANVRALVGAAGDGRLANRTIREALESGEPPAASGRAKAMLEAVGRHIPSPRAGVVNVLAVACPVCFVPVGRSCQSRRKKHRADVHPARLEDARQAAAGRPPVDRTQLATEQEQRRIAARALLGEDGPSTFVPPGRDEEPPTPKAKPAPDAES
jgi:hypothetical protein